VLWVHTLQNRASALERATVAPHQGKKPYLFHLKWISLKAISFVAYVYFTVLHRSDNHRMC